ncbi:MAG: hypothetical protein KC621_17045 [Myxococcales bacterium]|nr:hypothetical protein [Myxococcales bacterium]
MVRKLTLAMVTCVGLIVPTTGECAFFPKTATGYFCDTASVCTNFGARFYRTRTWVDSTGDSGTWSVSQDATTGQYILTMVASSGR